VSENAICSIATSTSLRAGTGRLAAGGDRAPAPFLVMRMSETQRASPYPIDLAAARLGGKALAASDEFFGRKEHLLEPGRGVFVEGKYTDRGKWMDGWETRRRRGPGHDWCIIHLGAPGRIRSVTVDTNHFKGNHPAECSLDAAAMTGGADLSPIEGWVEVVARTPLWPHAEHGFPVADEGRYTHVRLNIYPDGGVARLRVWGDPLPDWSQLGPAGEIDLASALVGGRPVECSDEFFSHPMNLVMPDEPVNMGDGWETRRRRGPGHDWVIVALGCRATIDAVEVHTTHFKGNFPESCSIDARDGSGGAWTPILSRSALQADARHRFAHELSGHGPATHVRLNIYPDGGVARLRVFGSPVW